VSAGTFVSIVCHSVMGNFQTETRQLWSVFLVINDTLHNCRVSVFYLLNFSTTWRFEPVPVIETPTYFDLVR
jgi:hypothetical protein